MASSPVPSTCPYSGRSVGTVGAYILPDKGMLLFFQFFRSVGTVGAYILPDKGMLLFFQFTRTLVCLTYDNFTQLFK